MIAAFCASRIALQICRKRLRYETKNAKCITCAVLVQYALPRLGSEFGSGVGVQDDEYLCWYNPTEDVSKPYTSGDNRPGDGYFVAAKEGGLLMDSGGQPATVGLDQDGNPDPAGTSYYIYVGGEGADNNYSYPFFNRKEHSFSEVLGTGNGLFTEAYLVPVNQYTDGWSYTEGDRNLVYIESFSSGELDSHGQRQGRRGLALHKRSERYRGK